MPEWVMASIPRSVAVGVVDCVTITVEVGTKVINSEAARIDLYVEILDYITLLDLPASFVIS